MESEERQLTAIREKDGVIQEYKNYEKNDFILNGDIIGLDANILVDLVCSKDFKSEIRDKVKFDVLKIYTTKIALGEARHVLIKKRDYNFDDATKELKKILKEFSIESIEHKEELDKKGDEWVNIIKNQMHIKKFHTFPNDVKILSNLFFQRNVNVYFTEDKDIKKAVNILKLKIIVKIIPEASNLNNSKIKEFFNQKRKFLYKGHKHS